MMAYIYLMERHFSAICDSLYLLDVVGEPLLHVGECLVVCSSARVRLVFLLEVSQVLIRGYEVLDH